MITINDLSVSFSGKELFHRISLVIGDKDRIGLVGKNGAGKSTLMKIIAGLQEQTAGNLIIPSDHTIGYLPQELLYLGNKTVLDEAMTAFDEAIQMEKQVEQMTEEITHRTDYTSKEYEKLLDNFHHLSERLSMMNRSSRQGQAERILQGLGFLQSDFQRDVTEFSTGWQMRIELAKILLKSPDVVLLDEPTNHLDIEAIQWLENFLKGYFGALILVSHDRAFLDNVTTRTVEVTAGKIYDYKVSYSDYVGLMQERKAMQTLHLNSQQREIQAIERFVERFRYKASKAKQVQSRIKQLEKMDMVQLDEVDTSTIHFKFPPAPHSGKIAIELKRVSKNYGEKQILNHIDLLLSRGEKVAFVGRNGEGKSTLSKIITGEIDDYEGSFQLGHQVKIGYFAQNQAALLNPDKTVFETIDDIAVGEIRPKIRSILGSFLFSEDDIDKKVRVLSGGEKARLALAKLLLTPVNLLILDEPTNHLDMPSKDILKNALLMFDGAMILVSHDRDFLQGLTQTIYEFKNKHINLFKGDIYDFLASRNIQNLDEMNIGRTPKEKNEAIPTAGSKQNYQKNKEQEKRLRKQRQQIQQTEQQITDLEDQLEAINAILMDENPPQPSAIADFYVQYEQKKQELSEKMTLWENLQMDYEKIQAEIIE